MKDAFTSYTRMMVRTGALHAMQASFIANDGVARAAR